MPLPERRKPSAIRTGRGVGVKPQAQRGRSQAQCSRKPRERLNCSQHRPGGVGRDVGAGAEQPARPGPDADDFVVWSRTRGQENEALGRGVIPLRIPRYGTYRVHRLLRSRRCHQACGRNGRATYPVGVAIGCTNTSGAPSTSANGSAGSATAEFRMQPENVVGMPCAGNPHARLNGGLR